MITFPSPVRYLLVLILPISLVGVVTQLSAIFVVTWNGCVLTGQ